MIPIFSIIYLIRNEKKDENNEHIEEGQFSDQLGLQYRREQSHW